MRESSFASFLSRKEEKSLAQTNYQRRTKMEAYKREFIKFLEIPREYVISKLSAKKTIEIK